LYTVEQWRAFEKEDGTGSSKDRHRLHRVLHGVYYIPALRNSIMYLEQLDEGGSKVEIDKGVLRI
jgi:hypothetical protein